MSTPGSAPRPVGPPPPPGQERPASRGTIDPGLGRAAGSRTEEAQDTWQGHGAPSIVRVYAWTSSGRSFPWLAVLLVVLGLGLLVELLVPDLSFASLLILAAGLALSAAWLIGRVVGATVPALVLTAWGLAGVGSDLGILSGEGWTALAIGLAFLAGWGLARFQGTRREWALFIGSLLSIIGLADVSDALPFDLGIVVVIPLAMIGIGIYLIARDRLPVRR